MKANTNTKTNNRKKLIPAAGALMISAAMLGTSTYAWFTMSREVEVKNVQMTATTPEDIQLSLGTIGTTASTAETSGNGFSLKNGTGVLVGPGGDASNGKVTAPSNNMWDWSNTADITRYYSIGKLIPASSNDGDQIYFTPDADGVGKTIKNGAAFIRADQSVNGATGVADSGTAVGYKATLHAYTDESSKSWTASGSTAYNVTNDDGYYVDIPVWLRTSSTSQPDIGVIAYVKPNTATTLNSDDEALYRAVRVAILSPESQAAGAGAVTATGLIPVADGMENITSSSSGTLRDDPFAGNSILNWYNSSGTLSAGQTTTGKVVAAAAAGTADARFDSELYDTATAYDKANSIVKLAAGEGTSYGAASQLIIRVWLEGEDPDCWNSTAGQDWSINLKFFKIGDVPSDADIETLNNTP